MPLDPVTAALNVGSQLIERLFPDPALRDAARLELLKLQQAGQLADIAERGGIVRAEAASEHWLAASWRPITMLTFAALIVARWLGYSAPGISEAEVIKLWDIVELGLGGYVVGRSVEKVVPAIAQAVKR